MSGYQNSNVTPSQPHPSSSLPSPLLSTSSTKYDNFNDSSPEPQSEKADDDDRDSESPTSAFGQYPHPTDKELSSSASSASNVSLIDHDHEPKILKTLYLFTRNLRKKYIFTDVAYPRSEIENVLYYIVGEGVNWYTKWEAAVHRGPNPKLVGEENSKVVARIKRSLAWRSFTLTCENENVEMTDVRLWKRGYEFELDGKKYRWSGTTRFSKLGKLASLDLKLVNSETKALIVAFERKVIDSATPQNPDEESLTKTELKDHRMFIGYLHFYDMKEMDELVVVATAYCVIEAEHGKRDRRL